MGYATGMSTYSYVVGLPNPPASSFTWISGLQCAGSEVGLQACPHPLAPYWGPVCGTGTNPAVAACYAGQLVTAGLALH